MKFIIRQRCLARKLVLVKLTNIIALVLSNKSLPIPFSLIDALIKTNLFHFMLNNSIVILTIRVWFIIRSNWLILVGNAFFKVLLVEIIT